MSDIGLAGLRVTACPVAPGTLRITRSRVAKCGDRPPRPLAADEFVRAGTDRLLLGEIVADLRQSFLGTMIPAAGAVARPSSTPTLRLEVSGQSKVQTLGHFSKDIKIPSKLIAAFPIDHIAQRSPSEIGAQIVTEEVDGAVPVFVTGARDMRRDQHPGVRPEPRWR